MDEVVNIKTAVFDMLNTDYANNKKYRYEFYDKEDEYWIDEISDITLSELVFEQNRFTVVKIFAEKGDNN